MMQKLIYIFLMCLMASQTLEAQIDSLQLLPEVVLSDVKLRDYSPGIHIETIADSTIKQDVTFLTEVLRDQSNMYFRENGLGGVSSASFRGTNAQQTAVIWNGININSQLTGQTDFNTIATYNYDQISIRSGGGSIPYGSGAVGGSVHLENSMRFGNRFENDITAGYASYDSRIAQAKSVYATDRVYMDIGGDYFASENDFKYLETDQINENGQFENVNLNANVGVLLAPQSDTSKNFLKLHHNSYLGDRNFAGTLIAPSDDSYQDRNSRTLMSWQHLKGNYQGQLSAAHIFEQFKYFPNGNNRSISSIGKANRFVGSYDATLRIDKTKSLKGIVTVDQIYGSGSSIEQTERRLYSAVMMYNHQYNERFSYGVQVRQELTKEYDNPFLVGVGGKYAFAKAKKTSHKLLFNASRNYRIPTFNDLYWQGAGAMGNRDLVPETSLQAEVGYVLNINKLNLNTQLFLISTDNLIVWQPTNQNIWSPQNITETRHYGIEVSSSYVIDFGNHKLSSEGNYSYTVAENVATDRQLPYVPKQQLSLSLGYQYKILSTQLQANYTDRVFVTNDESQEINGYVILDARVKAQLLHRPEHKVHVGFSLKNALNRNYQTVLSRPNPGRNILIQTTYNF